MNIAHDDFEVTYFKKLGSLDLSMLDCFPDFLVISPGKTGTTWLYQNLICHDEITISAKEINYFNIRWKKQDINSYMKFFQKNKAKIVTGDISPGYTVLPLQIINIIKRLIPDLKLIFLMRDPVDRAWSHVKYSIQHRDLNFTSYDGDFKGIKDKYFIDHFTGPNNFAYNDYLGILQRWLTFFPKEQFYIGFYESIKKDPKKTLRAIFEHLGVKQDVDWERFKANNIIFAGTKQDIPDNFRQFLRFIWKERTEELISFLENEFGITNIPPEWKTTLAKEEMHPVLVEKDFKGFGIVQFGDKLYGIPENILNNEDSRSLKKALGSAIAEGENIYQVRSNIARLKKSWIWSGLESDPALMRVESDIALLGDYSYRDVFKKVIDNDYLIYLVSSVHMREITLSNYKGFRIIYFQDKLYALAESLGMVQVSTVSEDQVKEWQKDGGCFIANTIKEVESLIDGTHMYAFEQITAVAEMLKEIVQCGEALCNNGETIRAYEGFSGILDSIDQVRETLINNIAVILAQEGDLEKAERLLLSLSHDANSSGQAALNLQIIRNLKEGIFSSGNDMKQGLYKAETKDIVS